MKTAQYKPSIVLSTLILIMLVPGCMTQLEAKIGPRPLVIAPQQASENTTQAFISYKVKLRQIKLYSRQGHEVLVLPVGLHINFVQYQNVNELLNTLSVPVGKYERVVLCLDYSRAQVVMVDRHGLEKTVSLVDDNQHVLTTLDVSINLLQSHNFEHLWGQALLL